jgi:quinol monooxygenase YgiN
MHDVNPRLRVHIVIDGASADAATPCPARVGHDAACQFGSGVREVSVVMLKVIAEDFIDPGLVDVVMPLYRELVEKTRQEARCVSYDLFIDQKDPGHFVFVEEWPDRAALDAHCRTEHFTRLVPLINQHQRKDARFILMEPFPA